MMDARSLVRVILLLGLVCAGKLARAGEESTFSPGNVVYEMKYTTSIVVAHEADPSLYLKKAYRHSNYLMGFLTYSPRRENNSATGSPLRKQEDVKVTNVKDVDATHAQITYAYDSEVVLNESGLDHFTLYLPQDYEAIVTMPVPKIASCSYEPGYVDNEDLLSIYWTPFAKYCEIPTQTVMASLTPLTMKITYPDYPRLVKDGMITVALLVGKMDEHSDHNPHGDDESVAEYEQVLKRMRRLGFVRTSQNISRDLDHSSEESYEANYAGPNGNIKVVVNTVFGNSVYATDEQKPGINDFYEHYVAMAKDSSFVVYSGHAGFMLEAGSISFHPKYPLVLDPDRYQIFVLNGCQTTDYAHPFFAVKDSKNLDMFVNARETIINPKASTAMLDAISAWATSNTWTSYPDLVDQMDAVDATLGVLGEQDNPTAPYKLP